MKVNAGLWCLFSSVALAADPSLTLYNQHFAVVREIIPLALKQGVNRIEFTGTTAHLEPESVILRDPSGKRVLQILEQNYRADPVSMEALLALYEGKTIEFQVRTRGSHRDGARQDRSRRERGAHPRALRPAAGAVFTGHHRDWRQTAFRFARRAGVSRDNRRHDPQAGSRLDDPDRPCGSRGCRTRLRIGRVQLGSGLQRHSRRWKRIGPDRLGRHGESQREGLRERAYQAHGGGREQGPTPVSPISTSGVWWAA